MPRQQAQRQIAVGTSLGDDVFLLRRMSGHEELGRPFTYDLELYSEQHDIDFNTIVGENMTVRLNLAGDETRFFNGFVSEFVQDRPHENIARYRARLVPWIWFLTRTADCRIFQNMTVPDIIKEIFRERGFSDFEDRLSDEYREWEYCVQYNETAFHFVTRLIEQEGIYYYFNHESGKHTLVLADASTSHDDLSGQVEIPFVPPDPDTIREEEHIFDWVQRSALQPDYYATSDFDFKNPKKSLLTRSVAGTQPAAAGLGVYSYPGEYTEFGQAEGYSRIRMEASQVHAHTVEGASNARHLCPGYTFDFSGFPRADQNAKHLILSTDYVLESDEFDSTGLPVDEAPVFECRFTAENAREQFRLDTTTHKPEVVGPQTAIVVGKQGEEIWTDEYGRVKVLFHWDRRGKGDETSSCWIRVAQACAGKNWGGITIPRIGQEVVVEFEEGDPDRPLITGRVYNGECMPPYTLPDNATMSAVKSNSSKGGGGFNEIRFEDKKDDEQLFVHAQKNMDVRVLNDRFETVVNDRHLVVENDKKEHVKNDRAEQIDRDVVLRIGRDYNVTVEGKQAFKVTGSCSNLVTDDMIEKFAKNQSTEVTEQCTLTADTVVIEAATNITLQVGESYVAIESGGIKIGTTGDIVLEGTNIEATAQANLTASASANAKVEGSAGAEVASSGITQVKGSMVKIN